MIDTLPIARKRHPGAKHSLDALCTRYGIDRSHRVKHGALLDAELLAQVYVELTGGRQIGLRCLGGRCAGSMRRRPPRPIIGRASGRRGLMPRRARNLRATQPFLAGLRSRSGWLERPVDVQRRLT